MQKEPLVSIIVPTRNSAKNIEACLKSIKNQTYSNIEIIVVDNYSKDDTGIIAQRYGRVYVLGPERSNQRNFGAAQSTGDFLVFIDSDMELSATVVEECVREALDKDADAVYIFEISVGEGFWTKCKALERSCYKYSSIEAARFFKREVFFSVNGYDENLVAAEDWDLSSRVKKAGFSFSRINALIKHHEGKLTLPNTIRKKFNYGLTINHYMRKHQKESRQQLIVMHLSFLKSYKRLLSNPLTTLGLMVMKICEFSASLCGILVNKYFISNKLRL